MSTQIASYRGFSFPFRRGSLDFPATATDDELLAQSIAQIVMTGVGERPFRSDFGTRAWSAVFENNDELAGEMLRSDVVGALARWEPRVVVSAVDVTRDEEAGELVLTIGYTIAATGRTGSVELSLPSGG